MPRRKGSDRRTPSQAAADRAATELSRRLGRMLREARGAALLTQKRAADRAGITQGTWSDLEMGANPRFTVATWNRAIAAVGRSLHAYVSAASAADQPRDSVHLRHQELIIRLSDGGAWRALPEEPIDREARTSRAADVLLHRRSAYDGVNEYALWDVWDWFEDVGGAVRDFHRRLAAVERYAIARMVGDDALPRTGGCWVVRATNRNRRLMAAHRNFFRSRFDGSPNAWLSALVDPQARLPEKPALVWVAVKGDRLFPARLG